MPIMDGYEATMKIRELERRVLSNDEPTAYIVGLTAHATETHKQ